MKEDVGVVCFLSQTPYAALGSRRSTTGLPLHILRRLSLFFFSFLFVFLFAAYFPINKLVAVLSRSSSCFFFYLPQLSQYGGRWRLLLSPHRNGAHKRI